MVLLVEMNQTARSGNKIYRHCIPKCGVSFRKLNDREISNLPTTSGDGCSLKLSNLRPCNQKFYALTNRTSAPLRVKLCVMCNLQVAVMKGFSSLRRIYPLYELINRVFFIQWQYKKDAGSAKPDCRLHL